MKWLMLLSLGGLGLLIPPLGAVMLVMVAVVFTLLALQKRN